MEGLTLTALVAAVLTSRWGALVPINRRALHITNKQRNPSCGTVQAAG
jgi:hypothetical protein